MVVKNWENPRILNGRAAICAGRDDMSGSEDEDSTSMPTTHRFSHPDTVKIVLESGKIPDAAMIHAARKRRQRARELGSEIPLMPASAQADEPPEKDKGRLIREDDDSDEERIDMSVNHAARDRDIRREQFFAAQDEESEHDTDKEMEEWENQQIRKGVTGAQLIAASQEATYGQPIEERPQLVPDIVPEPGVPRTPQAVADKLRERLDTVKGSLEGHRGQLNRVINDRQATEKELAGHEDRAPQAAQRFRFYQELRGYVTDLVECLDEKISVIANLELRALELMGRHAERLMERRRQDVRDQAEEVALQTRPTGAARAPGRAAGNEDEARVRRAAEREGRRSRRRRAREGAAQPRHIEGMSSDDEVPDQEALNYRQQRDALLADADQVFVDVVDEYASVGSVLSQLERWRVADMASYTEAYASMCVPKIVGPLVRLALVMWNPLLETDDLEKHDWYHKLMLYGVTSSNDHAGTDAEEKLLADPDSSLVPTVIERIVIPKLTQLIEKCWDPMSSTQTLRLVGLTGRYIRRYPTLGPDSRPLSLMFTAVVDKLRAAVEHDVFIPIFSRQSVALESRSPFFQRQFASALKLLRNVTSWQGLVSDRTLKELALCSLLNRYLLSGITVCQLTDAVAKAGLVSHILPRVWLQGDLPQLAPFTACVTRLAAQLDKDNPLHLESIDIVTSILKSLRCT